MHVQKLSPKAMALAFATFWGGTFFIFGVSAAITGYGTEFVAVLGKLYPGFNSSLSGIFFGSLWGAFDGFIVGYLIVFLYNFFLRVSHSKEQQEKPKKT